MSVPQPELTAEEKAEGAAQVASISGGAGGAAGEAAAPRLTATLDDVPDVDIDPEGTFKYVLIRVRHDGKEKYIVRGYEDCGYHADVFARTKASLAGIGVTIDEYKDCPGGGRIRHEPDTDGGTILVYGYSVGFGRADHRIAVDILRKEFSSYRPENISFSNDGY